MPTIYNPSTADLFQTLVLSVTVVAAAVGAVLWLGGARLSKTIISAILFSIGSSAGVYLPKWFGWGIDGWATALLAGALLGASGLFLHRFWVGIFLGAVLSLWGVVLTWHHYAVSTPWAWRFPVISPEQAEMVNSSLDLVKLIQVREYLQGYWDAVPIAVKDRLPYLGGAGVLVGLVLSLLRPRLAMALCYSAAGVTILGIIGSYAMQTPSSWAARLPTDPKLQVALIAVMTVFGMLVQWLTRAVPPTKVMAQDEPEVPAQQRAPGRRRRE